MTKGYLRYKNPFTWCSCAVGNTRLLLRATQLEQQR